MAYLGTTCHRRCRVGYIVGLNIGALALIGGMISWSIAIPIYSAYFLADNAALAQSLAGADAETIAYGIWAAEVRHLGVGAMLVGGVWALVSCAVRASGIRSGLGATCSAGKVVRTPNKTCRCGQSLIGVVLYSPARHSLPADRGQHWRKPAHDGDRDRRGLHLYLRLGLHGRPVARRTIRHPHQICTILFASLLLMLLMGKVPR
jgi:hypothetical protein